MSRKTAPVRRGNRWVKWLAIIVAGFVIFPIVQVGCVRMVNPPLTPLMLLRQAEAHFERHRPAPRAYHWIDLAQMPNAFLRCVLASEDQRFFQHHGFDWQEVEIARREALRKGTPPRGASTISMQCARSLFLWQGRSWIRKGLEAYYTFWMEAFLSKRRILELYGNVIEMGDGIYGLEAAAQFHYRVNGRALTREQAAMLAAILPNPREWDPTRPSAKLIARAVRILQMEPALKVPSLR